MNLQNVIDSLALSTGTAMTEAKLEVIVTNAHDTMYQMIYSGTVQEFIDRFKMKSKLGGGYPKDWHVVHYGYVAHTEEDESLPVFVRPIEIRVI